MLIWLSGCWLNSFFCTALAIFVDPHIIYEAQWALNTENSGLFRIPRWTSLTRTFIFPRSLLFPPSFISRPFLVDRRIVRGKEHDSTRGNRRGEAERRGTGFQAGKATGGRGITRIPKNWLQLNLSCDSIWMSACHEPRDEFNTSVSDTSSIDHFVMREFVRRPPRYYLVVDRWCVAASTRGLRQHAGWQRYIHCKMPYLCRLLCAKKP